MANLLRLSVRILIFVRQESSRMLDLRRPIYKQTAAYGHFGRTDVDLPWEKLDKVDDLRKYL